MILYKQQQLKMSTTQVIQQRLKSTAEKRAKLKTEQKEFDLAFCAFIGQFNNAEDDLPIALRQAFQKVKATVHCKNIVKTILEGKKTPAKPPTEEEKLKLLGSKSFEYSRCPCCETTIKNCLMRLHMGRAICQETATTRLTDAKIRKEKKNAVAPRAVFKDRVAELADKSGLTENIVIGILKSEKTPVIDIQGTIETELKKRGMSSSEDDESEDEPEPEKIPEPEPAKIEIITAEEIVKPIIKKKKKLVLVEKL